MYFNCIKKKKDQYQYLGYCPPTPPLTQQQSIDNKLGLMLGWGRDRWAVAQILILIQKKAIHSLKVTDLNNLKRQESFPMKSDDDMCSGFQDGNHPVQRKTLLFQDHPHPDDQTTRSKTVKKKLARNSPFKKNNLCKNLKVS